VVTSKPWTLTETDFLRPYIENRAIHTNHACSRLVRQFSEAFPCCPEKPSPHHGKHFGMLSKASPVSHKDTHLQ
jgi:hypothetical protein